MTEKTDAQLQTELRERQRVLTERRIPKLKAAVGALDSKGAAAFRAELTEARDALEGDDPARTAVDQLIQMLITTRRIVRHHLGAAEDTVVD
jgi:hypothetical protein